MPRSAFTLRPLWRAAIIIPIAGSALVHAAMWLGLRHVRVDRPERLTDAPAAESVLTFQPPPAPAAEDRPPEPPPVKVAPPAPPPPPPREPEPARPPESKPEPPPRIEQPAEIVARPVEAEPPAPMAPEPAPAPAPRPAAAVEPGPSAAVETPPEPAPATFAGMIGARASRIVYVVDASGPMTSSLPFVLAELDQSVSRLNASQSFQVMVFRDPPRARAGRPPAPALQVFEDGSGAGSLAAATPAVKRRLRTWLAGIQPSGRSDPREALVAALALKPDLVFLLTRSIRRSGPDASWAGGTSFLDTLNELNPVDPSTGRRPVVIKAIQFIDDDPTGLLRSIAAAHGDGEGSYRVMRLEEMPPADP